MYTSEKEQTKRLLKRGQDYYVSDRKLHLGKNEWHETTFVYKRKENSERTDYGQYVVFMTNAPPGAVREYSYRWENAAIETALVVLTNDSPDNRISGAAYKYATSADIKLLLY